MRKWFGCLYCGKGVKPKHRQCPRCDKPVVRVIDDRFEQLELVSASADCAVLHVWDRVTRQDAFVRALLSKASPGAQAALIAEARLLRQFSGKAGFPSLIHAGKLRHTGTGYTVQEFVQGKPLARALRKARVSDIVDMVSQALEPVAAMHAEGWVHCALSLNHLLYTPEGEVVLIDSRQARMAGERAGDSGIRGCRAPEQANASQPVTPATDVFALCACLYKLFTKRFPYGRRQRRGVGTAGVVPAAPSKLNAKITPDLDGVILKGLSRKPEDRFPTAQELAAALNHSFGTATVVDGLAYKFPSKAWRIAQGIFKGLVLIPKLAFILPIRLMCQGAKAVHRCIGLLSTLTGLTRAQIVLGGFAVTAAASFATMAAVAGVRASQAPQIQARGHAKMRAPVDPIVAAASPLAPGPPRVVPDVGDAMPKGPEACMQAALPASTIQFHAWPPAWVYLDGKYLTEAPSPEPYTVSVGRHALRLTARTGRSYTVCLDVPAQRCLVLKYSFDTGRLDMEDVVQ